MNDLKKISRYLILAVCIVLGMGAATVSERVVPVYADSGTVYSCSINRSYSHPVSGVIEDSGGESSYATGQGMVEGAVYADGMMEVTDSGGYYLTIRMSLMDYTSNQTFAVQNVGDSGWSSTGTAVTATGSDSNGTTADVCIQVPSENCIVRIGMYVSPMGRDVIFYVYPYNYSQGNSVGMNPAFVTEESGSGDSGTDTYEANAYEADTYEGDNGTALNTENTFDEVEQEENQSQENSEEQGTKLQTSKLSESALENKEPGAESSAEKQSSSDSELNKAQGLSLSTEEKTDGNADNPAGISLNPYVMLGLTIVVSGLILIGAAALVVWYFRKNWHRWGREDDEDDE